MSEEIITDTDSTWFCSLCDAKRAVSFPEIAWDRLKRGSEYPDDLRQEWLNILPRETLLNLLRMLLERYPDARAYPPDLPAWHAKIRRLHGTTAAESDTEEIGARQSRASEALNAVSSSSPRRAGTAFTPAAFSPTSQSQTQSSHVSGSRRVSGHGSISTVEAEAAVERLSSAATAPSQKMHVSPDITGRADKLSSWTGQRKFDGAGGTSKPSSRLETSKLQVYIAGSVLPSYEDMLVEGISYINDPNGSPPRILFEWLNE